MTKHARFKKTVRRHAADTGQRYTEALVDLTDLDGRSFHRPAADRLVQHLRDQHGVLATTATRLSQHNDHVFRVDRADGPAWVVRVHPPTRPVAGADGDAAILRFLAEQAYPAERLPLADPVSVLDGSAVVVTEHVDGHLLPSPAVGAEGVDKFAVLGDLLGRLHALPADAAASRPGGAAGVDPYREGRPQQDLAAALALLDAVDPQVDAARDRFEELRHLVRTTDAGDGLPEALVHGNLLHAPDHVVVGPDGPVVIQWRAAGRGPRLADLAYLLWGTWLDETWIAAAVGAYRRHVDVTDEELDRLAAVMRVRPLFLTCFDWHRSLSAGRQPSADDPWWGQPDLAHLEATAELVRAALRRV